MNKQPLLSVIVPIYNAELYLHKCIDSIINQTYPKLEIILVDDGSPDNCGAICDKYIKVDDRIRVIHKENGGESSARNAGLVIATGEYVCFCDADDALPTSSCEKRLIKAIATNADVVVGKNLRIYDNGKCVVSKWTGKMLGNSHLRYHGHCDAIYKLSLIKNNEISYPPLRLGADVCFTLQILLCTKNIIYIDDIVYIYYRHETAAIPTVSHASAVSSFVGGLECSLWIYSFLRERGHIDRIYIGHLFPHKLRTTWATFSQTDREATFFCLKDTLLQIDWSDYDKVFQDVWKITYFDFVSIDADSYYKRLAPDITANECKEGHIGLWRLCKSMVLCCMNIMRNRFNR